jgi:hypothetical protein
MCAAALAATLAVGLSASAGAQQQGQMGRMMQQGWQNGQGATPGGGSHGQRMGWGPMMGGMDGSMMGRGPMTGGPGRHVEGRLAFLRTELGITDAQEDAWNDYADAVRSAAGAMQQMHDTMMSGAMPSSLPERLEWREQMMSTRLETLRTLREAAVPLYEALGEDQQRVADDIMGVGMGMM